MRSPEEIKALLTFAREQRMPWIEVDGVKMPVPALPPDPTAEPQTPEISAGPGFEYTEEEILFYSTPHFDALMAAKEDRRKHAEAEKDLKDQP
jgi:hypothetical protein